MNDDDLDVADIVLLLEALVFGTVPIPPPFPVMGSDPFPPPESCGLDPTSDGLGVCRDLLSARQV